MSKNMERVLSQHCICRFGLREPLFVLAELAIELSSPQRAGVEKVVIDQPHIAVTGLGYVIDVAGFRPEMAERSVHRFVQTVGHYWMLAPAPPPVAGDELGRSSGVFG
jgi:hypothetical protein